MRKRKRKQAVSIIIYNEQLERINCSVTFFNFLLMKKKKRKRDGNESLWLKMSVGRHQKIVLS